MLKWSDGLGSTCWRVQVHAQRVKVARDESHIFQFFLMFGMHMFAQKLEFPLKNGVWRRNEYLSFLFQENHAFDDKVFFLKF